MKKHSLRLLITALAVLVLGTPGLFAREFTWHPLTGPETERFLVPGNPPLTVGDQNVFFNCVEFGLQVALTLSEKEALRSALMQEFLQQKNHLLAALRELRKLWATITAQKPDEIGKYRLIIRDSLLFEARNSPNLALSQLITTILKDSEEQVTPGEPVISRRTLKAFVEMVQTAYRLKNRRVVSWDATQMKNLEAQLLKRVPSLSPEGRKWLSNVDFHRAFLEKSMQAIAADEKESVKKLLLDIFAPPMPGNPDAVDIEAIPLPPPNVFPLPSELPWEWR